MANILSLSSLLKTRFFSFTCGSSTALRVTACGRSTLLLPRSRSRFVVSSMGRFCSKLLASGAALRGWGKVEGWVTMGQGRVGYARVRARHERVGATVTD